MTQTNRILTFVGIAVYAILFVLVALYVFVSNDESQPVDNIFQWNYFIPVIVYSGFSLWVSYGLFLAFKKYLNRTISFAISLMIGIPVGLIGLSKVIGLLM